MTPAYGFRDWPDPAEVVGDGAVDFTLTYRGQLLSQNAERKEVAENKRSIRRALSPQLQHLWATEPQLVYLARQLAPAEMVGGKPKRPNDKAYLTHYEVTVGGYLFQPLLTAQAGLICHLDIEWLRKEPRAGIVTNTEQGADIDNRLKTLFDALQIPQENQIPADQRGSGERLYCLLEDDGLIHSLAVSTGPLLDLSFAQTHNSPVELHIKVSVGRIGSSSFSPVGWP